LHVTNSTFYGNGNPTHTASVFGNPSSTTTAVNTIVAGNYGSNCSGAFQTASNHNLSSDATCSPGFTQVSTGSLGLEWQGWAIIIRRGSVAVDAGTNTDCPTPDRVGHRRPQDGDNNGSEICDVGDYEVLTHASYLPLVTK